MAGDVPPSASARDLTIASTPPLLLLLAIAGFVSLSSTRVCDAMLPALAQAFDTSIAEAAAAISAYAIAYGVMQLVYGPLGDRYGKKRVIMLATAWCALSTAAAASATSLEALIIARAAMGAGAAAIVPLSVAWIGDTVPLAQRQQVLARYSGITVFGLMLGPLAGGFLAEALSWRAAFVLLAVLFSCMSLVLLHRGRRLDSEGASDAPTVPAPYLRQLRALLADRWARRVLGASCVEAGLGIGCLAFVPTVLYARFGLSMLEGGAVAALFGVGGFVFSHSAAALLRRVNPSTMPLIAGFFLAGAYALLALMPNWYWSVAACTLGGFGFFMMHNTLQVQATQLSVGATGLAVSLFTCCIFIGQSVGVGLGALVVARFGPSWLFTVAAAGLLLLGIGMARSLHARGRSAVA